MQILGIHWDPPYFRTACLRSNRHSVEIVELDCSVVKPLYKSDCRKKIVTGLSGKDLFIRSFALKIEKKKHLEEALQFQAETSSHLLPDQVLSAVLLYENKKEKITEATYFTALKDVIQAHLNFYASLEIFPDQIGATPQALLRYVLWKYPKLQKGFFVDLGSSEWSCLWMENKKIKKSFSIQGGTEELLGALWEDRKKTMPQKEMEGIGKQIDLLQLKSNLNPHLHEKLLEKRQELTKTIYAFSKQASTCPIFFTGRTDAFVHFREYLLETMQEIALFEKNLPTSLEEHKYAISIGLALEQTVPDTETLQFLQGPFFPLKNWKKAGLWIVFLFFISLFCSFSLLTWNHYSCTEKEQTIVQSIEQLLSRCDLELKTKVLGKKGSASSLIQNWIATLKETDKPPSYILSVPKVSETLYWISMHPVLKAFSEGRDPIVWNEIKYKLLQFPKIGSTKEEYKAQVEINFSTESSTHARKFHEALLKGDHYVDAKQPIGWEASAPKYKVTFFLNQKVGLHEF